MQIVLTKRKTRHVWVGLNDDDEIIVTCQLVEHENIPPYCEYCRHQDHDVEECKARIRSEEYRERKEKKNEKRNRNKEKQNNKGQEAMQNGSKEGMDQLQEKSNEGSMQKQPIQQKEEELNT